MRQSGGASFPLDKRAHVPYNEIRGQNTFFGGQNEKAANSFDKPFAYRGDALRVRVEHCGHVGIRVDDISDGGDADV